MEKSNQGITVGHLSIRVEDLMLVVKALDVYAYSLYACGAHDELHEIQTLIKTIMRKIPPRELDS